MAIDALVEEVADNLEEVAEATRQINTTAIGYLFGGLVIGVAAGFYFGHKYNKEKLRAEAFESAENDLAGLRELYQQKMVAQTNQEKPSVETVVETLGYSTQVPERERPLPAPVPILDDLPEQPTGSSKSKNAHWSYEKELETRSPEHPYVIHQDEYNNSQEEYSKVVYTYYEVDDTLVDTEDDHPVPHADLIVGQDNLKWGHGSDDIDVVYVRNDNLDMDIQICRKYASYEEEVLGLSRDDAEN